MAYNIHGIDTGIYVYIFPKFYFVDVCCVLGTEKVHNESDLKHSQLGRAEIGPGYSSQHVHLRMSIVGNLISLTI